MEYYIRRNQILKYIIIDDDLSLFDNPKKLKIYVPDYRIGLVQGDIKKLLKIVEKIFRLKGQGKRTQAVFQRVPMEVQAGCRLIDIVPFKKVNL